MPEIPSKQGFRDEPSEHGKDCTGLYQTVYNDDRLLHFLNRTYTQVEKSLTPLTTDEKSCCSKGLLASDLMMSSA